MTKWDYGPEGRAYPVERGQAWSCGSHLFVCASAFQVNHPRPPFLVYSDPPWNQGNLASFHTKAGLTPPGFTWLDLYRRVIWLAAGGPCFIEGGNRQADAVAAECAGRGIYRQWPITYYRRQPAVLHYCGPELPDGLDPTRVDDDFTPGLVLNAYERATVLDPCAGRGVTSRAAQLAGWASVNVEIHPRRLSAALARMHSLTGNDPMRSTL